LLVHSDGPGSGYSETVYVVRAQTGRLTLQSAVANRYLAARSSALNGAYAGDAVGRYASVADLWPTHLDAAVNFFGAKNCATPPACDSLYTDVRVLEEGAGKPNRAPFLPFIANCYNMPYCAEVAHRYFDSRIGDRTAPGHTHFVAATTLDQSQFGGVVGTTYRDQDPNQQDAISSYAGGVFIWNQTVQQGINGASPEYSGLNFVRVVEELSTHELVHLFDVNPPAFAAPTTAGHCTLDPAGPSGGPLASNGTGRCLMNRSRTNPERGDGLFGLHVQRWATSEYRRVRARPEPLPQTWQSTATPVP
jgi:hypothetical protein